MVQPVPLLDNDIGRGIVPGIIVDYAECLSAARDPGQAQEERRSGGPDAYGRVADKNGAGWALEGRQGRTATGTARVRKEEDVAVPASAQCKRPFARRR